MAKLTWDASGERFYETGVKKGVLFVKGKDGKYGNGVAWNGLTAVTETPSGAEATPLYADDIKYLNLVSAEEFGGTIEAYMYPDAFMECNGEASLVEGVAGVIIGQQARKEFGFSYRTTVGNDTDPTAGYKIHIVYNCLASTSEKAYSTINNDPEAMTFSFEFTTTPVEVAGMKPTAILTIDTTKLEGGVENAGLKALEAKLYGADEEEASLPSIAEIAEMFKPAN